MSWQSSRLGAVRIPPEQPATSDQHQAPHRTAPHRNCPSEAKPSTRTCPSYSRPQSTSHFLIPIAHHPSPITHHPSPITHHPSPITHHQTYAASPSANRALCLLSTLPLSSRISRLLQIHPPSEIASSDPDLALYASMRIPIHIHYFGHIERCCFLLLSQHPPLPQPL